MLAALAFAACSGAPDATATDGDGGTSDGANAGDAGPSTDADRSDTAADASSDAVPASDATPPSDAGTCGHAHEPNGMTQVADLAFSGTNAQWTTAGTTSYQNGTTFVPPLTTNGVAVTAPGATPESPSGIFQIHLPKGQDAGKGTGGGYLTPNLDALSARSLYVGGWFKVSTNWFGEATGTIKMIQPLTKTGGVTNRIVISCAHGAGAGPLSCRPAFQSTVVPNGSTSYYAPANGTGTVNRGAWHHVELLVVGNSAGNADGRLEMWLDCKQTHSLTGLQFDAATTFWRNVDINSVYGGSVGMVPDDQYIWWDHLYVSWAATAK